MKNKIHLNTKKITLFFYFLTTMALFSQNRATFYYGFNFTGTAVALPEGTYKLSQLNAKGIGDNQISSIKVTAGYQVTIFDADNFNIHGFAQSINGYNVSDLNRYAMHDKMTSVIIRKIPTTTATFYTNCNYAGVNISLPEGFYDYYAFEDLGRPSFITPSIQLSSLKTNGLDVKLHSLNKFREDYRYLTANVPCLSSSSINFDNKTQSLIVIGGYFKSLYAQSTCTCTLSRVNGNDEVEGNNEVEGNDEGEGENNDSTSSLQFEVYPNPASTFVDVSHSSEIAKIELIDFSGEKVDVKVTESPSKIGSRIDLTNFRNGIYIVVGTTKDGKSVTKKIAIQK